jgi:small-conductance mechanosensitive channel
VPQGQGQQNIGIFHLDLVALWSAWHWKAKFVFSKFAFVVQLVWNFVTRYMWPCVSCMPMESIRSTTFDGKLAHFRSKFKHGIRNMLIEYSMSSCVVSYHADKSWLALLHVLLLSFCILCHMLLFICYGYICETTQVMPKVTMTITLNWVI